MAREGITRKTTNKRCQLTAHITSQMSCLVWSLFYRCNWDFTEYVFNLLFVCLSTGWSLEKDHILLKPLYLCKEPTRACCRNFLKLSFLSQSKFLIAFQQFCKKLFSFILQLAIKVRLLQIITAEPAQWW